MGLADRKGYLDWLAGLAIWIGYLVSWFWLPGLAIWTSYPGLPIWIGYLDCSLDWLSGLAMHIWVDKLNFKGLSGLAILAGLSGLGCPEKLSGLAAWIGNIGWLAIWIG